MSTNILDFVRPTDSTSRRDINKILELIHDIVAAPPEDEGASERIVKQTHTRLRTSTLTFGSPTETFSEQRDREPVDFIRKIPPQVRTYDLIHTENGTVVFGESGHKFGGKGTFDGSSDYITIADDYSFHFEHNQAFTIAFWYKTSVTGTDEILIFNRPDINGVGYGLYLSSLNRLIFEIQSLTQNGVVQLTTAKRDGTWHSIVVTYPGLSNRLNMKIYEDGVLIQTGTATTFSTTFVNNDVVSIGAGASGAKKFNGSLAWITILRGEKDAAWVTDYHNGVLDTAYPSDSISSLESQWIKYSESLNDKTSNANNLTKVAGTETWKDWLLGKGISLDGSTYYTSGDAAFDKDITNPFSISFWLKTTVTGSSMMIVGKGSDVGASAGIYVFQSSGDDKVQFRLRNASTNYLISVTTVKNDGIWHHFVITKGSTANLNAMKIYVDGLLDVTGGATTITGSILNNDLQSIGGESDGGRLTTGDIADVRWYNKELSATEVTDLAESILVPDVINDENAEMLIGFNDDLNDATGNLTPTENGTVSFVTGRVRKAGEFGSGDWITYGDPTFLDGTNKWSIFGWIRPDSAAPASWLMIFSKEQTVASNREGVNIHQRITTGEIVVERFLTGSASGFVATTIVPAANEWTHIAVTYDGTNIRIYVNGVLDGTSSDSKSMTNETTPLTLGRGGNGTSGQWLGDTDEFGIISRVLSALEIKALAQITRQPIVTVIPMVGSVDPAPDATSGMCRSS